MSRQMAFKARCSAKHTTNDINILESKLIQNKRSDCANTSFTSKWPFISFDVENVCGTEISTVIFTLFFK